MEEGLPMSFGNRPTKTYLAQAIRLGVARDQSSAALEFVSETGEHIGVALSAQALRGLRDQIQRLLEDNPGLGTGPGITRN